jgi:hypothetical protein
MAVLVMLNNYLHDLATAVFAVSALAAYLVLRSAAANEAPVALRPVAAGLVRVGLVALVWTLAGGVVRALAYTRYEWMEAAGRAQIPALVVKHVILVSLVIAGLIVLWRAHRTLACGATEEPAR